MADAAPLAGIRAVERGSGLGASYAGFLLGALGAEVVRVEQRDAGLSRRERALARGKRSVILRDPPATAREPSMLPMFSWAGVCSRSRSKLAKDGRAVDIYLLACRLLQGARASSQSSPALRSLA